MAEGEGIEPPRRCRRHLSKVLHYRSANLPVKSIIILVISYLYMYYLLMHSEYSKSLINILGMLRNIEKDLNLVCYNETEKKIYYSIVWKISQDGQCNMSDVIDSSGFSRSTVYKTIKKFESANLVLIQQSQGDKREFNLVLA